MAGKRRRAEAGKSAETLTLIKINRAGGDTVECEGKAEYSGEAVSPGTDRAAQDGMTCEVPEALRLREEAICAALRHAIKTGGETGQAAELLEAILVPHLAKERADVLQPLALLPRLARGEVMPEMAEVLPQIDRLKADLHGRERLPNLIVELTG